MPRARSVSDSGPPTARLYVGGAVFVFGWLTPLFVPLVASSDLSTEWKTLLSGLLLLGIPEVFSLIAVAILGKDGFSYLKRFLLGVLRRHFAPPAVVSPARYRIGLVMFLLPLLFGWMAGYVPDVMPGYASCRLAYALGGDSLLLISLFVLGADFWDKLRALFIHGARAVFPEI